MIPYPAGQAPNQEGAWSAPAEINHDDSPYFTKLDVYQLESINGRRVVMPHYPSYQQTTEYTCGPAATLTLLYWHGNKDYDELSLAREGSTIPSFRKKSGISPGLWPIRKIDIRVKSI